MDGETSTTPVPASNEAALQAQIATLQAQLQKYQGQDLDKLRGDLDAANTRIKELESNAAKLTGDLGVAQLQNEAFRTLSAAGMRPEYEELILPHATGALTRSDKGDLVWGDKPVTEFLATLKARFPAAFHVEGDAGGTGGVADGAAPASGTTTVKVDENGLFSAPAADVLSGKVAIAS